MNNNIIKYNIPERGSVTIKVVDIIGTPMRVILNNHKEAGEYEISLDAEHLPTGKYYYKVLFIEGENASIVNKLNSEEGETIASGQVKIED